MKTYLELLSSYSATLCAWQNRDGGWGTEEGAHSLPIVTAQVLLALEDLVRGFSGVAAARRRGLNYLRRQQSVSGGWPSGIGADFTPSIETVTTTSHCVQALCRFGGRRDVLRVLAGTDWLCTHARDDGLWGNQEDDSISMTASAFALQALALSPEMVPTRSADMLKNSYFAATRAQNEDGGFGINPSRSDVAASLQMLYAICLLGSSSTTDSAVVRDRLIGYLGKLQPEDFVTTYSERKKIGDVFLQFEHFCSAWTVITATACEIGNDLVAEKTLQHLLARCGSQGCLCTPGGRILTWSTAESLRALLSGGLGRDVTRRGSDQRRKYLRAGGSLITIPEGYDYLRPHLRRFFSDNPCYDQNVFIMMRYGQSRRGHFERIEAAIKSALAAHGLTDFLARDCEYHPSLFENLVVYMLGCSAGIAVFEELETRDFNPNVSIELGFMFALGKPVLLLKDSDMPRLPTDIVGRLYRDFDTRHATAASVKSAVVSWVVNSKRPGGRRGVERREGGRARRQRDPPRSRRTS